MTAMGFMVWENDAKGRSVPSSPADWWPTTEGKPIDEYDGVIILVDEADKLGMDEKKIVGEAALSKMLGTTSSLPDALSCSLATVCRIAQAQRGSWIT